MYCSGCGRQVSAEERVCAGCGRELWGSGALRMVSPREPAQRLSDVFPAADDPAATAEPGFSSAALGSSSAEQGSSSAEPVEATAPRPMTRIVQALGSGPALTSLPSLSQITTRPRTERDSLALHRRNQLVMTACFAAVALALALIVVLAQMLRASGPVRLAGADQPKAAPASPARKSTAPSAAPSTAPKPKPSQAPSRALRLPADARACNALVGASEGTSCGLAKALALTLPQPPTGTFVRTAKSPASGKSYQFRCTVKELVTCRTDRGSTVYVLI